MRKIVTSLALAITGLASFGYAQQGNQTKQTVEMVQTNKTDMAFAGAPFINGDSCNYMFHSEANTLMTDCHNNEGMLTGT